MAPTAIPTSTSPPPEAPGRGAWRIAGGLLPLKAGSASRVGYYRLAQPGEAPVGSAYIRSNAPLRTYATMAVNYGTRAIQRLTGLTGPAVDGWFGPATDAAVRAAQRASSVIPDGIVGPATMRALLTPLLADQSISYQVPPGILGGLMVTESVLDPGAVGVNGTDTGLAQINRGPAAHPEISAADALDPWFVAMWTAQQLRGAYEQWVGHTEADPWDIAAAMHNSPTLATAWAKSGKPPYVQNRVIQIEDYVIKVRTAW